MSVRRHARLLAAMAVAVCSMTAARGLLAADPLHVRIDKAVADAHIGPVAPTATDAEFLRRITLDFTGSIPSSAVARKFLADRSPNKRAALIDRLLGSPAYARRMAGAFDIMLMERRGDKHVKSAEWQKYVLTSFQLNKPYNQLAAEILGADGVDAKLRGPAKFYLDREAETNLVTREVGRMFFGIDLEGAQCHDPPLIDDYLQADYYGIYAFVSRSYIFKPNKKKPAVLAEKPEGDVKFKSVFPGDEGKTRPRLPGGQEIDEPSFKKGEEYQVKPNPKKKNIRPIPKYSRRAQLAKLASDGTNRAFNRNIVNRLWALMMGRGLVHPVDLHHSANPPAHPELLEMLADDFVAMKFDIKAFMRELALTQTYQRSFKMPQVLDEHVAKARQQLPAAEEELKQRQAVAAQTKQTFEKFAADLTELKKTVTPLTEQLTKATAALSAGQKTAADTAKAAAESQKKLTVKQDAAKTLAEAVVKIQEAAKKLPADKELAQVAGTFQKLSAKQAGEVAALTKTVATQSAAAKAAAEKMKASQQAVAAVTTKVNAANKVAAAAVVQLADAEAKLKAAQAVTGRAERRVLQIKLFTVYGGNLVVAATSRSTAEKATANLAAAQTVLQSAEVESAKAQAALAADQKTQTATAAAFDAAGKNLADRQAVVGLISESLAKAELALQKLPKDADLILVTGKLKGRAEQLKQDIAAMQKLATTAQAAEKTAAGRFAASRKSAQAAAAAVAGTKKLADSMTAQLNQSTAKAKIDQSAFEEASEMLADHWSKRFAITPLEQLSPEDMAWSVMQAAGLVDRQRTAAAAEINKKTPLKPEELKDPAKVAERARQIEQAVHAKLKGNVAKFVKLFGAGAGDPQHEFFATVDQALFFANGGEVRGWLGPGGGNLTDRLIKTADAKALADELYLSVLTRLPTKTEAADVSAYLTSQKDKKNTAVQELVWALVTSTEFRFNH